MSVGRSWNQNKPFTEPFPEALNTDKWYRMRYHLSTHIVTYLAVLAWLV